MTCTQCGTLNDDTARECRKCKRSLTSLIAQGKIPCYIHTNREATSTCAASGVRICPQCTVSHNGLDYAAEYAPAEAQRAMPGADLDAIPVLDKGTAEIASFGNRLTAWLIDTLVVLGAVLFLFVVVILFRGSMSVDAAGVAVLAFLALIGSIAYSAFMTAIDGQTVGKRTAGIMVLRPDGHPIDLQTSLIRSSMGLISLLPLGLGFLWSLWDKDKQTWHDKVAGTSVFKWSQII